MAANLSKSDETKRQGNNRERSMRAIRHLHRLLGIAADPKFSGTIAVEINAKNGLFGPPKLTEVKFDYGD